MAEAEQTEDIPQTSQLPITKNEEGYIMMVRKTQWLKDREEVGYSGLNYPGYSIYKIEFKDGAEYVGKSKRLVERLLEHFDDGEGSKKVYKRLCAGQCFRVHVLSAGLKKERATAEEDMFIRSLSKPLNETPQALVWDDKFDYGES